MASPLPDKLPNNTKQANTQQVKPVVVDTKTKHPKLQEYTTVALAARFAEALQEVKVNMAQEMESIVRYDREIDPVLLSRLEKIQSQLTDIVHDLNNDF